jgi:hypothetical protein
MPAKYLTITVALFFSLVVNAQQEEKSWQKDILILSGIKSDNQYVIDFTQQALDNMRYGKNNEQPFFRSVMNASELEDALYSDAMLASLQQTWGARPEPWNTGSPARTSRDSMFLSLLMNFDYLLRIEIVIAEDSISTILEKGEYYYKFSLQPVINTPGQFPVPGRTTRAYLRIKKGKEIRNQLKLKLRELFPESNEPPYIKIISGLTPYKGQFYMVPGDTLRLRLNVKDADSDPYLMNYLWKQLEPNAGAKSQLKPTDSTQQFVFRDTGTYSFAAQVSDRISFSNTDTFTLHCIAKPVIQKIRNCYYVRFKKKFHPIVHPFDAMYQPYLFFDTTTTRLFNITEIYPVQVPASDAIFQIVPVPSAGHIADSIEAATFFVYRNNGYVNVIHRPVLHSPGVYDYQVRLYDHGIASAPVPLRLRYRKASPVYTQWGVFFGKFRNDENAMLSLTSSVGAFLHRYLMAEYYMEFPLHDSLFGKGLSWRYANHRLSFLTPVPLKRTRGVVIAPELGIWLFHTPVVSKEFYSGMNFGLNLKLLYSTYPWLGTCYRIGYTETRQLPGKPVKTGMLYMGLAFTIQPISKKGRR